MTPPHASSLLLRLVRRVTMSGVLSSRDDPTTHDHATGYEQRKGSAAYHRCTRPFGWALRVGRNAHRFADSTLGTPIGRPTEASIVRPCANGLPAAIRERRPPRPRGTLPGLSTRGRD